MKIITDKTTRLYELTYLVPAVYTESEWKKIQEKVADLVAKFKGKVVEQEDWGKKTLAYKIRFHNKYITEAYYTFLTLDLDPEQAPLLEKKILLIDEVARHLLVRAEKKTQPGDQADHKQEAK